MNHTHLAIEQTGQSGGHCDCCGHESRTVWGNVASDEVMVACYFVHWTRGQPEHYPNLDFLIGSWGDNAKNDQLLVSWVYSASRNQFMLIDGPSRPAANSELCSRALTRDQVLSDSELLGVARAVLDAVWIGEKRIEEVKASNDA